MRPFSQINKVLTEALVRFGLNTSPVSPQYPFWRLQNDKLAEVFPTGPYKLRGNKKEPTKSSLLENDAHGGLLADDYCVLENDLDLQSLIIHKILDSHFPRSIHEDILNFFDLRLSGLRSMDSNTEGEFRNSVIAAYDSVCAFSGYSITYRNSYPGLEAAHICWPQSGGNDEVSNGIAMNSLFLKLFHLGLFTIDDDLAIRFSKKIAASIKVGSILEIEGAKMRLPKNKSNWPDQNALAWHRDWVFRG